jgi:hypothetical protein
VWAWVQPYHQRGGVRVASWWSDVETQAAGRERGKGGGSASASSRSDQGERSVPRCWSGVRWRECLARRGGCRCCSSTGPRRLRPMPSVAQPLQRRPGKARSCSSPARQPRPERLSSQSTWRSSGCWPLHNHRTCRYTCKLGCRAQNRGSAVSRFRCRWL